MTDPTTSPTPSLWEELSFLALPDMTIDWRKALLYDLASGAEILTALPASPDELASRLGLDPHAVRVVLDALAVWDIVDADPSGTFGLGHGAPGPDAAAVLRHHGRAIRLWATTIPDRLAGVTPAPRRFDPRGVQVMLDGLVVNARESAPGTIDASLAEVPDAKRVLDVGGGHGEYALEFARRGLAATMCDRPDVIAMAGDPHPLTAAGITVFAGDFFEALPEGPFDIVFCAGVTYTLDGDRNIALYRRLRPLIAPGGALAIMSFLGGTDELASIFAVQMLGAGGGDSHHEDDYRAWLAAADYAAVTAQRMARRPEWLIVARP